MKNTLKIIGVIAGILVIISMVFGFWNLQKHLSYKFSYKAMVEKTIKEVVKPECLK
jgi:hypothetical protein